MFLQEQIRGLLDEPAEFFGNLVVQFDGVPKYSTNGAQTFQAVLYPNGTIMYYYHSMTATILNSATIGIQNATRDDGLTVVYNDDYIHDEMAIRLAPIQLPRSSPYFPMACSV